MSHVLDLVVATASGEEAQRIEIARAYNLSFTLRDEAKMRRHLDEVRRAGVAPPVVDEPPLILPISPWANVLHDEVLVQGPDTSGEVELVVIDTGDEVLVGVGSDHTDRRLETIDIPWSKQVAPNVIAPTVWRWRDVRDHWDDVTIESTVVCDGVTVEYQSASVADFWTPIEMLERVAGRVDPVPGARLLLSGTVATKGEVILCGEGFAIAMKDPVLGRAIRHRYDVTVLEAEIGA